MSSLSTLLEAARFLELQEQEQQHRATVEAALATMEPMSPSSSSSSASASHSSPERIVLSAAAAAASSPPNHLKSAQHNGGGGVGAGGSPSPSQTVLISSNNISSTLLHAAATATAGPVTFSSSSSSSSSSSPSSSISSNSNQVVKKMDQDGQVTSTTTTTAGAGVGAASGGQLPRHRLLHNSFDIINPLVIDETNGNDLKRKQPPMVFRAGTREVHNKLEKHRRAHLKECFDILKKQLPATQDEKKVSNLSILHSALRYIQTLKRKERELEHEMERLAREKISAQQRLAVLKKEITSHCDNVDFSKILPDVVPTATTTQNGGGGVGGADAAVVVESRNEAVAISASGHVNAAADEKITAAAIPILAKAAGIPIVTQAHTGAAAAATAVKEATQQQQQQPVQTTALSVLPMTYPVNQGLVLQKVIVPKGLDGLTPLVQTHFITAPQQINGKVLPLAQYLVKPLVVVSTASPRPS